MTLKSTIDAFAVLVMLLAICLFIIANHLAKARVELTGIKEQLQRTANLLADLSRGVSALLGLPAPEDLRCFAPNPPPNRYAIETHSLKMPKNAQSKFTN